MALINTTKARSTGATILLIDNRPGHSPWFDEEGLLWFTVCDTHNMLCGYETRKAATENASEPQHWCEECRDLFYGPGD